MATHIPSLVPDGSNVELRLDFVLDLENMTSMRNKLQKWNNGGVSARLNRGTAPSGGEITLIVHRKIRQVYPIRRLGHAKIQQVHETMPRLTVISWVLTLAPRSITSVFHATSPRQSCASLDIGSTSAYRLRPARHASSSDAKTSSTVRLTSADAESVFGTSLWRLLLKEYGRDNLTID